MKVTRGAVKFVAPPDECEVCGGTQFREPHVGELHGWVCLGCGRNNVGVLDFDMEVVEMDVTPELNDDGSVTLRLDES